MISNDIQRAGSSLSDSLGDFVSRKLQKIQQQDMLKSLLQGTQQGPNTIDDLVSNGLRGGSVSQSLNVGDLLGGGQQDAVMRSFGRTPIELPSFGQSNKLPAVQSGPPMAKQPEAQPDRSYETPAMRSKRELEEIKGKNAKQVRVDKETFPYYKKLKDQYATTPEVDARLDEMEQLLDTGQVQGGTFVKTMESLSQIPYVGKLAGAIEQAFLTTESQIFKKLSTDFLRDAKPYFGNNLSTREVELFLERVPSLMLSNDGNRAVIRNFRALNDYVKASDKIMEGIIAENGGERPRHLESRVQERMKPNAEKLRKAFRDSAKLIPQKSKKDSGSFTKKAYEKSRKLA